MHIRILHDPRMYIQEIVQKFLNLTEREEQFYCGITAQLTIKL